MPLSQEAQITEPCQAATEAAARLGRLIRQANSSLGLDLSGLAVLTEAASGAYVVTPIIAALAGAQRVIALTKDSRYASADEVVRQTRALELAVGIPGAVEICKNRSSAFFSQADIVTNLGFLRPIDVHAVADMKATAIVPLMCEAWEIRPGDVDLAACRKKGILVLGTDEHHPAVNVFSYSGWLALKMLFEAGIEIHKNEILVVSCDEFGVEIEKLLRRVGARVQLARDLKRYPRRELETVDALVICDYTREDYIIGHTGDISPCTLASAAPGIRLVLFAGLVDVMAVRSAGIPVFPHAELPPHRMSRTLAALGPRPVVELHAAGLKVAEVAARMRRKLADPMEARAAAIRACGFATVVEG